jgi:hypothetical protein
MSNPMKYIKDLEAAGFQRAQAEAQVQVVLDAIEGDLVTKSDFAVFQERYEGRFAQFQERMTTQFDQFRGEIDSRFAQQQQNFDYQMQIRIRESEFRITTRLGLLMVSSLSIAVATLTWLIKV